MASLVPATLTPTTQLGGTTQVLYTGTAGLTVGRKANFVNVSASSTVLTLFRVPAGQTAGSSNIFISTQQIAPGVSYICNELNGMVFGAGDTLQALAGAAAAINATVSGVVYTP